MASGKSARTPSEHTVAEDPETGTCVHQLTGAAAVSHHLYFLTRSITSAGHVVFASYRTGTAQFFALDFPDGEIVQLTDGEPVHGYSGHLSPDDRSLYFVRNTPAAAEIWALDMDSLDERLLASVPGGQMGEVALGPDGQHLVTALKSEGRFHLMVLSTEGGGINLIHSQDRTIIHPQFSPASSDLIEFASDPAPRMHVIHRDGSGLRCLYEHTNDEFVVHECFLTADTLAFVHWPFALRTIEVASGRVRGVARFNAWHIAPDRAGERILCDTAHPDTGLQIVDVRTGERRTLCHPQASNGGSQWRLSRYALPADFAAAAAAGAAERSGALSWMEMKVDTVYGPQWTHPHPSWSPDERLALFTSDRSGAAQVYAAEL